MSFQDRIQALRSRHADLEAVIAEEIRRPMPDMDVVNDLKRQKLRIKDEIAELEKH